MNRWLDRGITLLLLVLLGWAGWSMLHWLLVAADWSVVATNLPLYAVGSFLRINAGVRCCGWQH